MNVLPILFGAVFTVLVCTALGVCLLHTFNGAAVLSRGEAWILRFLAGSAALSCLVFLLAVCDLARWQVFLVVGILAGAGAASRIRQHTVWRPIAPVPGKWLAAWAIVLCSFGAFYFFHAMKPEASPDGATYHLGLVARILREHGIPPIRENLYAGFPKGMEMLNLFAFAFGRHSAAALVHFSFLLALTYGVLTFARRVGHPVAGIIASLLFFLSPVVALNGTTAYNDVALASACFGSFWLIELWKRRETHSILALAGFVAGFAFSVKYTGATAILYVLAAIALHARRTRSALWPRVLLAFGFAILSAAPYLVHNWEVRGNPLAPFFNSLFPNPYVHLSFEEMAREMARYYPGLASYWRLPLEVTVRGGITQGFLGPVFLLAPVSLLALRSVLGRKLLLAAAVFALPFAINVGTRTLTPALPFVCLAMGLALARMPAITGVLLLAIHTATVVAPLARLYATPGVAMLDHWPVRAALRLEPEERALQRLAPGDYDVTRVVNLHVPSEASVFALAWVLEAYTTPEIRTHHLSAANERLAETLWTPLTPELQPLKRFSFTFPRLRMKAIRFVQTAHTPRVSIARREPGFILNRPRIHVDHWGIAEVRFYAGHEELPRKGRRASAYPNPWDAALGLDGNPNTAWRTWQTAGPGMFFEVEFGGSVELDQASFDSPLAQVNLSFRLEARDEHGKWIVIPSRAEESRRTVHYDLRKLAVAALRREGLDYLLVDPSVLGAKELYEEADDWGLHFIDQAANGVRLYRIVP